MISNKISSSPVWIINKRCCLFLPFRFVMYHQIIEYRTRIQKYYHFQSKEEILDAMVERMTDRLARKAKDLAGRKEIPVLQRLTMMIKSLHVSDEWENGIKEQMHKPQNALMHQKMQERLLATMTPLITGLIEEGIAQGICQKNQCIRMIFQSRPGKEDLSLLACFLLPSSKAVPDYK